MTLADILVAHRHDMLRLWMLAVRREAPETQALSDADLTSNFPMLFDRLIRGLEGEPPPVMPESRADAATRKRQGIGLPTLVLVRRWVYHHAAATAAANSTTSTKARDARILDGFRSTLTRYVPDGDR